MTTDGMLALHTLRPGEPGTLPLVLLHGFPLDHRMWLDVTDLIAGDRTVLAPDLPGFGSSPTGRDVAGALGADPDIASIDVMADGVAATLRAAGVHRVVAAGLSMGGYVAIALAERHPALVAGLGLVDTKSTADDEPARARRLAMADTVLAEVRIDAVLGMRTRGRTPSHGHSARWPTVRTGRPPSPGSRGPAWSWWARRTSCHPSSRPST